MRHFLISKFLTKHLKGIFEIIAVILAIVVPYYELQTLIPQDPIIILEVEKLTMPSVYSLTGGISDQNYSLEYIKLYSYSDNPVNRATFKYDRYTKEVEVIESQKESPYAYIVSRELLQQAFGESDNFAFHFLADDRFTFSFQFEGMESEKVKFDCHVLAVDNHSVPCEVKEAGYISLFRGIPWYFLAAVIGVLFIIIIEVIAIFLKFGRKKVGGLKPVQD